MLRESYVMFSCGHRDYIRYTDRSDMLIKMHKAKKSGICSKCRRTEFYTNSEEIEVSYSDFKKYFEHHRGVEKGIYNRKTNKIKLRVIRPLLENYNARKEEAYIDAEYNGKDKNGNDSIIVFLKGNSYPIKEQLKSLGFRWVNKRWQRVVIVFPDYSGEQPILTYKENTELVQVIEELEKLGCISYMTSLKLP